MTPYERAESPQATAFPVARAGWPFIFAGVFVTAVLALLGLKVLCLLAMVATAFVCYFFRDPDRVIPTAQNAVVSPADGKVIAVDRLENSEFSDGPCLKISIFMSVFNVHVNRIPFSGTIEKVAYHPGKFFSANLDKASRDNEHNAVFLTTEAQQRICFVQIAGLVARRIICYIQKGDQAVRGRRFGLICFGSRLDVYLPPDVKTVASIGQRVQAGTSILGELP